MSRNFGRRTDLNSVHYACFSWLSMHGKIPHKDVKRHNTPLPSVCVWQCRQVKVGKTDWWSRSVAAVANGRDCGVMRMTQMKRVDER